MDQKKEGTFIKDQNSFWAQSNDDLLEFLKEDLQKTNWGKAIIEGVPEDKVLILQNWIKKNKGKIEGVDVSIKPTLTGLTIEEEETFEMKYRAELDCNRVQLCLEEIEKFQRYNEPDCPEEWKPPRLVEKLGWWKQMLEKAEAQDKINAAQLKRENEATKENEKTAKKSEPETKDTWLNVKSILYTGLIALAVAFVVIGGVVLIPLAILLIAGLMVFIVVKTALSERDKDTDKDD